MRDLILKYKPGRLSTTYYHIVAWALFITYEVSLSAAIRESFNRLSDYILHYLLYILLFYVHCYLVLGNTSLKKVKDYFRLLIFLLLELACYYGCNVLINDYLVSSGSPVNVIDTSSRLFHLATFYRFIYIAAFSTAFRIAINLIKSHKKNLEFITETLIHEREKESLRTELVSAELSFLRSQINPHFLFNSLNSVYNRIRKNDPHSAEYVMALADLMKYALQPQDAEDKVPVESELEHISNYMKLQQMRYATDIDFNISIDDKELKIIPLLLITMVENVFQHGDLKNEQSRPVIEITVSGGELVLQTKNLIRKDHRPGNGLGMANIRKRLELQYKNRYILEYSADQNTFNLKLVIKLR